MKTKTEILAQYKKDYPILRSGDDEQGYKNLSLADYEATIEEWANNQLANEAKAEKVEADKATAQAKLAALGLTTDDLKALGL